MREFFASFSNREIAFLFWMLIIISAMLFYKPTRQSIVGALKIFFAKKLLTIFFLFIIYVAAIVFALFVLNFWERSLLKDTIFWTFGFAITIVYGIYKIDRISDFKTILKDAVKWTIVIEFLVAFYTFSFICEAILLPILVFIGATQGYSDTNKNYIQLSGFLKLILNLFGIGVLGYVIYKTFFYGGELISTINFKSFVLPIILTALFIPFAYLLALYSTYDSIFVRLRSLIKDENLRTKAKWQILKEANFNFDKSRNISQNIAQLHQLTFDNLVKLIIQISKTNQDFVDESKA